VCSEFDTLPAYKSAAEHAAAAVDTPVKASVLAALELTLQKLGEFLNSARIAL
jgi:hypothetical protein